MRVAAGQSTGDERAKHQSRDQRNEQVSELIRAEVQMIVENGRRSGDVQEQPAEIQRQTEDEQNERHDTKRPPIRGCNRQRVRRLPFIARECFGQHHRRPDP